MKRALTEKTELIFEKISKMETIKPFVLVGGTALSLQIGHRKSEDLDFMKWRTSANEKMEVDWFHIEKELSEIGNITSKDLLDIYLVNYTVDSVKLSFYATNKYSPVKEKIEFKNNIKLADIVSILAMKMEVLMRRSTFRDYYDIYSILRTGVNIYDGVELATRYSGHRMKTKNLIAILTNSQRFKEEEQFKELEPIYNVNPAEIEAYIKECFKKRQ